MAICHVPIVIILLQYFSWIPLRFLGRLERLLDFIYFFLQAQLSQNLWNREVLERLALLCYFFVSWLALGVTLPCGNIVGILILPPRAFDGRL